MDKNNETPETENTTVTVARTRQSTSLSATVENIKSRVNSITNNTQAISGKLLSHVRTKDVDSNERILTESVVALEAILPKSAARGFFSDILEKIPFAKKIKDNVEKTIIDNINAEEASNRVFKALETQITHMTADLEDLTQLLNILDQTSEDSTALENEINVEIEKLQNDPSRRLDVMTLRNLEREISSIKLVNKKNADNLDMELTASSALAEKMHEIKPLMQGLFETQLVLSAQNEKTQRVHQTATIVSTLMNKMIIDQDKQSHKSFIDTVKLSQTPIITKKTLEDLSRNTEQHKLEVRKVFLEIKENQVKYQKALANTRATLENSNIKQVVLEMPELDENYTKKK